jgi:hypothetical protein
MFDLSQIRILCIAFVKFLVDQPGKADAESPASVADRLP